VWPTALCGLDKGVALVRDGFPRDRADTSIAAFVAIWDQYLNKSGSITGMLLGTECSAASASPR